jgi:preprotein translocase YajC subunit
MKFLLAEEAAAAPGVTQWILPAVLLVLVIGIFVLNYFRSKKNQEQMKGMVNSLKVGDNVKTYSGLYGKIIEIIETTDGKVAVLETGTEKNRGIFSIDINAIYGVDAKQPVVYDANGNIIDPNAPVVEETANAETKVEEVAPIEVEKKETKKKTTKKVTENTEKKEPITKTTKKKAE